VELGGIGVWDILYGGRDQPLSYGLDPLLHGCVFIGYEPLWVGAKKELADETLPIALRDNSGIAGIFCDCKRAVTNAVECLWGAQNTLFLDIEVLRRSGTGDVTLESAFGKLGE